MKSSAHPTFVMPTTRYKAKEPHETALPVNHPKVIQLRTAPFDQNLYWAHKTAYPDLIGQDGNFRRELRSFPQLQQELAGALETNNRRFQTEVMSPMSRSKVVKRFDYSTNTLPTFTPGSDWFRAANESTQRRYNNSRFSVLSDQHVQPLSYL